MSNTFVIGIFEEIGGIAVFLRTLVQLLLKKGVRLKDVINQMYEVGVHSVPITVTSGMFVGAIMAIQINEQLKDFGAQSFLGGLTTSVTIRDVGPVLIGFLLSGKVGAYTTAELGTMKVTDQIAALECLGINALEFIVLPRLVAVVASSFLLLVIGLSLTVVGGAYFSMIALKINLQNYVNNIPQLITQSSVVVGICKSFVFGLLIGVISCYKGYSTTGGAEGVGKSVKSGSVTVLVWIIIFDFGISFLARTVQEIIRAYP